MAPLQLQQQETEFFLDALYCEEERWDEGGEELEEGENENSSNENCGMTDPSHVHVPLLLLEQDLFWEDQELLSLFSKEQEIYNLISTLHTDSNLLVARREAVEWILKVNAHYAFSTLTAVLAVNYLDRFITSLNFQRDKPWMIQLASVACLSLAAKVEETQVPLLLDLQVEETKYIFEAKTIQRMELLVLSTLHWRMNPVTPLSFLDHIIRRLGLKSRLHWEFMRKCERLLLYVIADSRSVCYLPSVLATATMLHIINQVEHCNPIEYQNQLMGVLKIDKDKIDDCYELILESISDGNGLKHNLKRKYQSVPGSPNGVMDATFSCDSSNESWAVGSSIQSSPERQSKKNRVEQQQQIRLPTFNRLAVDILSSPR